MDLIGNPVAMVCSIAVVFWSPVFSITVYYSHDIRTTSHSIAVSHGSNPSYLPLVIFKHNPHSMSPPMRRCVRAQGQRHAKIYVAFYRPVDERDLDHVSVDFMELVGGKYTIVAQ